MCLDEPQIAGRFCCSRSTTSAFNSHLLSEFVSRRFFPVEPERLAQGRTHLIRCRGSAHPMISSAHKMCNLCRGNATWSQTRLISARAGAEGRGPTPRKGSPLERRLKRLSQVGSGDGKFIQVRVGNWKLSSFFQELHKGQLSLTFEEIVAESRGLSGLSEQDFSIRLNQLQAMVPPLQSRSTYWSAACCAPPRLGQLVARVPEVARRMVEFKQCFPSDDPVELVLRHPELFLEDHALVHGLWVLLAEHLPRSHQGTLRGRGRHKQCPDRPGNKG